MTAAFDPEVRAGRWFQCGLLREKRALDVPLRDYPAQMRRASRAHDRYLAWTARIPTARPMLPRDPFANTTFAGYRANELRLAFTCGHELVQEFDLPSHAAVMRRLRDLAEAGCPACRARIAGPPVLIVEEAAWKALAADVQRGNNACGIGMPEMGRRLLVRK